MHGAELLVLSVTVSTQAFGSGRWSATDRAAPYIGGVYWDEHSRPVFCEGQWFIETVDKNTAASRGQDVARVSPPYRGREQSQENPATPSIYKHPPCLSDRGRDLLLSSVISGLKLGIIVQRKESKYCFTSIATVCFWCHASCFCDWQPYWSRSPSLTWTESHPY